MALVRHNQGNLSPIRNASLSNSGGLWSDFDRLFSQVASPAFGQFTATTTYPVDLYETDQDIVLEMAVPGVKVEDLDISIEGRQLTIQGTLPQAQEAEQRRYWLQNIPYGQFSRTVTLPATVEADNVQANVHDGLLVLTMPKVAEARARKIQVQTK